MYSTSIKIDAQACHKIKISIFFDSGKKISIFDFEYGNRPSLQTTTFKEKNCSSA